MCHSLSQVLCVHIMEPAAYVYGVTGHVCLPFLTNFTPLIGFFKRLRTTDQWANQLALFNYCDSGNICSFIICEHFFLMHQLDSLQNIQGRQLNSSDPKLWRRVKGMYKSENKGAWIYVISLFLLKRYLVIGTSQFPREKCPQLLDEVAFILNQVLVVLSIRG